MKKKNNSNLKRISAVLTTALMAASAVGMSVSASSAQTMKALKGTRTVKTAGRTTKKSKSTGINFENSSEQSIYLVGNDAKPNDVVEVDLRTHTGNTCNAFDVDVEFDSRLELDKVVGASSYAQYDMNGRKFITIVNFQTGLSNYQDETDIVKLYFKVPKNAENDYYDVKFSQVTTFANEDEEYESYQVGNATINVTGGVEKKATGLALKSVKGLAGHYATVDLVSQSNNRCESFDILVEYDSRLALDNDDVMINSGTGSYNVFEQDGKNYVALVGFRMDGGAYTDGESMMALNFILPEDATEDDEYEVKIADVTTFADENGDIEKYELTDAAISVYEKKADEKLGEYKLFQKFDGSGKVVASVLGVRGDANGDNKATAGDAAAIANALANRKIDLISEKGIVLGDVDDNNKFDVMDALKIARHKASRAKSWG